jgi:hypothetical protein
MHFFAEALQGVVDPTVDFRSTGRVNGRGTGRSQDKNGGSQIKHDVAPEWHKVD